MKLKTPLPSKRVKLISLLSNDQEDQIPNARRKITPSYKKKELKLLPNQKETPPPLLEGRTRSFPKQKETEIIEQNPFR